MISGKDHWLQKWPNRQRHLSQLINVNTVDGGVYWDCRPHTVVWWEGHGITSTLSQSVRADHKEALHNNSLKGNLQSNWTANLNSDG